MKSIPQYNFYKTKYGEELLIDVVTLDSIRKYIRRHPVHTLSYFDITFITEGTGSFSLGNQLYTLSAGDVLFSRPGEIRCWHTPPLPAGYALIFEEDFLHSFFNDPAFIRHLSFFHPDRISAQIHTDVLSPRLLQSVGHITAEIRERQTKDTHMLRALLYETLTLLNREYTRQHLTPAPTAAPAPRNRHIDPFLRAVDRDFRACHDTRHYADLLCITPTYLNELVQKNMGVSAKSYIQHRIIREAKILLSYTHLSINEIAGELGFEDTSYFIRLFRKQTRLTPLQYRQSPIR